MAQYQPMQQQYMQQGMAQQFPQAMPQQYPQPGMVQQIQQHMPQHMLQQISHQAISGPGAEASRAGGTGVEGSVSSIGSATHGVNHTNSGHATSSGAEAAINSAGGGDGKASDGSPATGHDMS